MHSASEKTFEHDVQVQYLMLPASVHVAALASVITALCAFTGMTVSERIISCVHAESENRVPQDVHLQYSVFPSDVQVASVAGMCSAVCAILGTTGLWMAFTPSSSENRAPHTVQCQYSMLPVDVHVAATAAWWTRECP